MRKVREPSCGPTEFWSRGAKGTTFVSAHMRALGADHRCAAHRLHPFAGVVSALWSRCTPGFGGIDRLLCRVLVSEKGEVTGISPLYHGGTPVLLRCCGPSGSYDVVNCGDAASDLAGTRRLRMGVVSLPGHRPLFVLWALFCVAFGASGATYYIDYASGSDSNSGTAKTAPWQHAPGMRGCTVNCASARVLPGDSLILKGGVTWPAAALCWDMTYAGNSTSPLYIGVDTTWYAGSSWSRPTLNGGGADLGACVVNGGSTTMHNVYLVLRANYVTIDNLEFTGALWVKGEENHYIDMSFGPDFWIVENNYFHGWRNAHSGTSGDDAGQTIYRSPGYSITSGILDHNIWDGADTPEVQADLNCTGACLASGEAFYGFATEAKYNVIRYMSNGMVGDITVIHDNLVEYIRQSIDPTNHMNGFENNTDCNSRVYGNVIRHLVSSSVVALWVAPSPSGSCTDYVFNNVIYDTGQANCFDMAYPNTGGAAGSIVAINNTIECGPDAGTPAGQALQCLAGFHSCTFQNNHVVSTAAGVLPCGSNCIQSNNVYQSRSVAIGQGYLPSGTYAFSPANGSGATIGSGTNLAPSLCSVDSHTARLCNDTTYGVQYDATRHTISVPGRVPTARPTSGTWDAGAYLYGGGPQPPSVLTGVGH